jgi:hypothetical protein
LHFPFVLAQRLDLVAEAIAAVGDDPLDVAEPVLERAELGAQLATEERG